MTKKDPYLRLGFGMISYFNLLYSLICLFSLLTLLSIPSMLMFSTYHELDGVSNTRYAKYSLGNMGYSQTKCFQSILGANTLYMECKTGTITEMKAFGLIPDREEEDVNLQS